MKTYRLTSLCLLAYCVILTMPLATHAADFMVWPNAQVYGAYNNNITTTSTNQKGDFLAAVSPGATLESDSAPRDFFLTYQTLVMTYLNYTNEDRFARDNYVGLRDYERLGPDTSLTINDSFLMGNSISGGLITNGTTPVTPQLLQALLYQSTSSNNNFNAQLTTRLSNSFLLSAAAFQNLFVGPSNSISKYNFSQGGTFTADRLIGERITAGFSYQFSDYRFSGQDIPTSDANWPQVRLGWDLNAPLSVLLQVGPVIASSSSGTLGGVPEQAQTTVDVGYMLTARYLGRRWTIDASAGQVPSLSSGLGGYSSAQTYTTLVQYKLTRLATAYANGGYYSTSGTGVSDHVLSYSAGISYRMSRLLALNVSYLGYQTRINGSAPTSIGAATAGTTNTNLFLLGLTITPDPLRWMF